MSYRFMNYERKKLTNNFELQFYEDNIIALYNS